MIVRWRLFPKYATLIIALVASMLVASGAVGLYFSYRENQDHLLALQQEKAEGAAARIEQYVQDIEHQLSWTALPRADSGADPLEARRIEYLKLLRQAPAITELVWVDDDGKEQMRVSRLAMDASSAGGDLATSAKFLEARGGKVHFSSVYFRKGTEPYMTMSRPAGSGGGVTVAEVNLKFVWDVVSRIKIGEQGLAYAVDANATLIAHPDISLVLKKIDMQILPQVAALATPDLPRKPLGRDLKGEDVFTAHGTLATLGWTVFVEAPRAEVLRPLYGTVLRMGIVLAIALVISMAASFFLARTLVRPLQALQEGAARIGAGELEQRIDVHTGDELEGLAAQFNKMGADLQASYAGLERKVEERTAEVTQALERQTATSEILKIISGSPTDVQPTFNAIVQSARRLFAGKAVALAMSAGSMIESVAFADDGTQAHPPEPWPLDLGSGAGTSILESRVLAVPDTIEGAKQFARMPDLATKMGYRSALFVPLLREGKAIGCLTILRVAAGEFAEKEITLGKTFADQAVIAIENVRLFHEIRDKSAQLEMANKHKSEFLANMSHELRTPLNAIIGFSEVLTEQMFGEVNDKQMEYLKDIHSSGHHLLSLINDILDLSKIEAGRMELDLSGFNLPMLLDNCTTLVRERASRHGLALALDVQEGLGDWVADERKIKQVVINLLSNAVKFTPVGGAVTLRARQVQADSDLQTKSGVEIAVVDTGVGIAPDQQALVFEEFRQADGNYLSKAEGTGLGLSLAKRFVELHGGTMRLQSAPGQGSTFSFILPERELEAL